MSTTCHQNETEVKSAYSTSPLTSQELFDQAETSVCEITDVLTFVSDLLIQCPAVDSDREGEAVNVRKQGLISLQRLIGGVIWKNIHEPMDSLYCRLREMEERHGVPSRAIRERQLINDAYGNR